MAGEVDLWVLDHDGADVTLPDLGDYTVTPIASGVGSVSVDYPADGRRFAALRALVDEDRPIDVELRVDGTSAGAVGGILFTAAGDAIAPGSVWTFTGYTLEVVMRRARTPHNTDTGQGGNERGETSLSGTPGAIVRTLMQRAQARGVLTNVSFGSFSNTLDSNGQAWAKTASVVLAPGRDYAEILTTVLYENALADWQVVRTATGYELRLHNPGTLGVDRALPGPGQVTIEHGRDMEDAPVKHDVTDVATLIIAAGKDGAYQTGTNASAEARLGYRVEGYASFGEVSDSGTLTAAAQLAATDAGNGRTEHTHGLLVVDDQGNTVPGVVGRPLPGRDFGLSDWILRAVDGQVTREQVVRYTLARRGREVRCATTLGGVIEARSVVLRRAIDRLTSGSAVPGASAPPPDFDDGKAPAAPTGLIGTSAAYYDSAGAPSAQVTASWLAVTTNDDETAIGDLSGYEVQFRYLPGQAGNPPSDWQTAGITSATTLRWSPLVQGRAIELRVLAYDRYNRESAWSTVFPMTTATDADAPPVLSALSLLTRVGQVWGTWDGKGAAGEAVPEDFLRAEVHRSTTPGALPDRPLLADGRLDEEASTTYRGDMRAGMTFPDEIDPDDYGTTFYYRLVGVDRSGNAAAASAQSSIVAVAVQDGEVATITAGKITAGIIAALVGIGQRLYAGDPGGAGWEGDPAGFRFYTGVGAARRAVLEFIASSGALTLLGRLIAGAGIGQGSTIDVDPGSGTTADPPRISLYPNATLARLLMWARTGTRPDGTTGAEYQIASVNASTQYDGFSLSAWSSNLWIGHRLTSGAWDGARLVLERLGVARLTAGDGSGFVQVDIDGDVQLNPGPGRELTSSRPFGTNGAGFSFRAQSDLDAEGYRFVVAGSSLAVVRNSNNAYVSLSQGGSAYKTFVIPHPTDAARWLVHACTESPEALVEYHGEAVLHDGAAVVTLPGYFEALTDPARRQVQATMILPDEPLAGMMVEQPAPPSDRPGARRPPVREPEAVHARPVAASVPREGKFRLVCPAPDGTRVAWRVVAARRGTAFAVEPLRRDVTVRGDGPYRYIADPGSGGGSGTGGIGVGIDLGIRP